MTDETPYLSRRERRLAAEATLGDSARPMPARTGPTFIIPPALAPDDVEASSSWSPAGHAEAAPLPQLPPEPTLERELDTLGAWDSLGPDASDNDDGRGGDDGDGGGGDDDGDDYQVESAIEGSTKLNRRQRRELEPKLTRKDLRAQRHARRRWWHPVLEFGVIVVCAALVIVLLKSVAFRAFEVPSESMNPTLITNDHIIAEMITPRFDPYKRGDVVVFRDPNDWLGNGSDDDEAPNFFQLMGLQPESTGYLVKRIIAVPGDTIIGLDDGTIIINDKAIDDPYSPLTPQAPFRWTLSDGDYWMMGDNRGASADSRMNGPAHADDFVGRVAFRFMPFDRFGPLD